MRPVTGVFTQGPSLLLLWVLLMGSYISDGSQQTNRQPPQGLNEWKSQLAALDALASRSGPDERSVADVANAIAARFLPPNQMHSSLAEDVTGRFARTELRYRRGAMQGIRESDFVRAFNQFMRRVSAPDYCRISQLQVETKRQMILTYLPHLIGNGARSGNSTAGWSQDSYMSPLETEFVLFEIVNLKLLLPREFQVTPEEWDSKHISRLAHGSGSVERDFTSGRPFRTLLMGSPLESAGLYVAALRAMDEFGYGKLMSLVEASLDAMGVQR